MSSAAGYFVEASGATGQDPCAAGSASGAESKACDACAKGRYAAAEAATRCDIAAAGSYAASTGSSATQLCAAGRYSGAGATTFLGK